MSDDLERFEEGLGAIERIVGRGKNRVDGRHPLSTGDDGNADK